MGRFWNADSIWALTVVAVCEDSLLNFEGSER